MRGSRKLQGTTKDSGRGTRGTLFARAKQRNLFSIQDLDEVIAELGLHRPQDFAFLALEGRLLKLRDHFALAKPAQVPTAFPGRALRVLAGHLGEALLPGTQLFLNLYRLLFGLAQDMNGMNFFYH